MGLVTLCIVRGLFSDVVLIDRFLRTFVLFSVFSVFRTVVLFSVCSVCPVIRVTFWYSVVVLWWGFIGFSYRFMFINCSI